MTKLVFICNFFRHEALVKTCQTLRLPDDVTMGIIVTEMLKVPFVESFLFHSPFDRTPPIDYNISFFKKQVSSIFR